MAGGWRRATAVAIVDPEILAEMVDPIS